mgnify:CR=1 FL=1
MCWDSETDGPAGLLCAGLQAEAMEKFVSGTLNTNLAAWEKILEGGKSFIANDKLSIADAGVFLILETFEKISPESVSKFPNLVRFLEEFKVPLFFCTVSSFSPLLTSFLVC